MKRLLFALLGFLLTSFAETYSQGISLGPEEETVWYEYEFDSQMDVTMPGEEVYIQDTTVEGKVIFQLHAYYDFANFAVQRIHGLDWRKGRRSGKLPYDKETLLDYYSEVTQGIGKAAGDEDLTGSVALMSGLVGYEYEIFGFGGDHYTSGRLLLLEDSLYIFSYTNSVDWDESEKSFFFTSAIIHDPVGVNQYPGEKSSVSLGSRIGSILFFLAILVGGVIVVRSLVKNRRHRKRMENTPWRPSEEFFNPPSTPSANPDGNAWTPPSSPETSPPPPPGTHSPESPSETPRGPDEPPPLPPR